MSRDRLETALEDGLVALPEGRIAVLRPGAGADLGALPRDRTVVVTTDRVSYDAFEVRGYEVAETLPEVSLAVVTVPRSKSLARALVAEALGKAGTVVVDGQKTDGVDSLWRESRKALGDMPGLTQGHGRLFVLRGDPPEGWASPGPTAGDDGWHTQPGVFSEGRPDAGSLALAEALPQDLPARMADLGAGWGVLSRAVLERKGVASLDLVEAERLALDCARLNVTDPRARFHWANALTWAPDAPLGGIVMNPPFHQGRAAEPDLGRAFISAAAGMLGREGALWLVANRQLPYEDVLAEAFRTVEPIGGDGRFKLLHAARPLKRR